MIIPNLYNYLGGILSFRELYYQQLDNFQLLQNAMQLQILEDERMRQLERLHLERQIIINERKANNSSNNSKN